MLLRYIFVATLFCAACALKKPIDDVSQWTLDTLQSYLDTYRIPYPGQRTDESKLVQIVKHYHDMVARNAKLFGAHIDHALTELKIKLEANHQIQKENVQAILDELRHRLRYLELHGNLDMEKISAEMDSIKHRALRMRWVTEEQWKQMVNDIETALVTDTWYHRFLVGQSQTGSSHDGFQRWVDQLESRFRKNKQLTVQELEAARDTIKQAIRNTPDLRQVGDKAWWWRVENELKHKMPPESVKAAIESIRDDIQGYRVFAMDYLGEKYDQTQNMLQTVLQWGSGLKDRLYALNSWWWKETTDQAGHGPAAASASSSYVISAAQSRSLESLVHAASSSARSAVHSVSHAAAQSSSSLSAEALHAKNLVKHSFVKFWRDKEREAYRRIGYTEAHVDWIQDYLAQSVKDKKSLAKNNVDQILHTIRRFLLDARVQSASQIEHQITRLQNLLEQWKRSLPTSRYEL